jgi:predicted nucleotide-binding protein (sugar kinase/HSP70/actin superfamily)
MGNYHIGFEAFFRGVEIDFFPAPAITKRTVELGIRYSPEFVCFPFKINLGNLIEALEVGADILFQSGGRGACRYGSYLDLQKEILKELGFNHCIYRLFDTSNISETWGVLKKLNPKINFKRFLKAFWVALVKIRTIDRLEDCIRRRAAYIEDKKELPSLKDEYLKIIRNTDDSKELKAIAKDFENRIKKKMNLSKNPLKIGIVGELYVVMEPYSNLELERQLTELDVEVLRPLCLSAMVKEFLFLGFPRTHYLKTAQPYLRFDCCAHSNVSVAETIIFAKEGVDGVIHIKPHACMPEVTAMSALYRVSKDYNIPVLFFSFDEHTTSVGVRTRLEAFVELIKRRSNGARNREYKLKHLR